jgi:hypothetical protein
MTIFAIITATICLLLFGIIGVIDGFYYHLWKFKLHKHTETCFEHWTHTIRATAFLVLLYLLFLHDYGGVYLLIAVGVIIIDIVVLFIDLIVEKDSRKKLGGLPHNEYIVHILANTLHFVSIALILVSKPLSSWGMNASVTIDREFPQYTELVAYYLIPGVALLVLFHFTLMNKKAAILFDSFQEKQVIRNQ